MYEWISHLYACHFATILLLYFKQLLQKILNRYNNRSDEMKTISASIFILSMTASSLLAGNCANHNKTNLEAMSCEAGFTWNETKAECVQDTA